MSLEVAFPSLYSPARVKEAWVGELWCMDRGGGGWNPIFCHSFNKWELEELECFWAGLERRKC